MLISPGRADVPLINEMKVGTKQCFLVTLDPQMNG